MTSNLSRNLKLSQDRHGFWILSHANVSGEHTVRVVFPPQAERNALQAMDRLATYLQQIQPRPSPYTKTQIMTGRLIIQRQPSHARAAKQKGKR